MQGRHPTSCAIFLAPLQAEISDSPLSPQQGAHLHHKFCCASFEIKLPDNCVICMLSPRTIQSSSFSPNPMLNLQVIFNALSHGSFSHSLDYPHCRYLTPAHPTSAIPHILCPLCLGDMYSSALLTTSDLYCPFRLFCSVR